MMKVLSLYYRSDCVGLCAINFFRLAFIRSFGGTLGHDHLYLLQGQTLGLNNKLVCEVEPQGTYDGVYCISSRETKLLQR